MFTRRAFLESIAAIAAVFPNFRLPQEVLDRPEVRIEVLLWGVAPDGEEMHIPLGQVIAGQSYKLSTPPFTRSFNGTWALIDKQGHVLATFAVPQRSMNPGDVFSVEGDIIADYD